MPNSVGWTNSNLKNDIYRQPAKDNSGQLWSEVPPSQTRPRVPHAEPALDSTHLRNTAGRPAWQTALSRPNRESDIRAALLLRAPPRDFAQTSHESDRASFGAISCKAKQREL